MERRCYVVDAFTNRRYAGNPAAVVLDTDGLDDQRMQAIAAEFNLSETAFVLPPQSASADIRIRWFTPAVEVEMCGHATIGGVHALVEAGVLAHDCTDVNQSTTVAIDTLSGTLSAFVENMPAPSTELMLWLDLPDPEYTESSTPVDVLSDVLRVPRDAFDARFPIVNTSSLDQLVFVKDEMAMNGAQPDFEKLGALHKRERLRGLCLATAGTLTPSLHLQSRFFAPAYGINEDPVTGSVHGPLAAYAASRGVGATDGDIAVLTCTQGVPGGRSGLLHVLVQRRADDTCAVRIGGHAVTTMRGVLVE